MTNTESDLINRAVFEHLNCNEIDLYSDTAQMMILYFWKLFVKINKVWTAADLMRNIDKIYWWHYCSSDNSVDNYFIVHSY